MFKTLFVLPNPKKATNTVRLFPTIFSPKQGEIVQVEEDSEHEFKSIQNSQQPINVIAEHCEVLFSTAFHSNVTRNTSMHSSTPMVELSTLVSMTTAP